MAEKKKKIIFVNGVFDLIHVGHIRLLKYAKSLGDLLIVSIDTDDCAYKWKGRYPVMKTWEREELLRAIRYVDMVLTHEDDKELLRHIEDINPAFIVKGPDYKDKDVVGSELAPIKIFEGDKNISTSDIIKRIRLTYG